MKLFVTGATGFIGAHVVARARAAGHAVVALAHRRAAPRFPEAEPDAWVTGTLDTLDAASMDGCDAVVHLAAAGVVHGAHDALALTDVNVRGTMRVLQAAQAAGVTRTVVVGSCFEYGRSAERYDAVPVDAPLEPVGAYAATKAAASLLALSWARDQQTALALVRPFLTYGCGEAPSRLWPSLCAAAARGDDFACTPGDQVRDFVRVEVVADTILDAATVWPLTPGAPVVRNIGSGVAQTVAQFCEAAWHALGARGSLRLGALPYRPNEVMRYVPDLSHDDAPIRRDVVAAASSR